MKPLDIVIIAIAALVVFAIWWRSRIRERDRRNAESTSLSDTDATVYRVPGGTERIVVSGSTYRAPGGTERVVMGDRL